jgi:CRP-like cAMP-binding protein
MEMFVNGAPPAQNTPRGPLERGMEILLRQHATPRIFRRHEPLFLIGDVATHVFLIERGEIALSCITPNGRELTLETLDAGELFGEADILLGQPRASQALACGDCVVYQIPRDDLMSRASGARAVAGATHERTSGPAAGTSGNTALLQRQLVGRPGAARPG